MTINELFDELENKVRDTYIVTLKYKYDFEKDQTIENQILEYDSMDDNYVWLVDWYEGQTDVEVLGYMILGDVDTAKLEPCKDAISRAEVLMHSHIEYDDDGMGHRVIYIEDIEDLPSVTPQTVTDFADKCKECGKILNDKLQARWIPVSERLPEDGTWNIWQSKTGALSIERYKEDAYDHFCPSGRFFQLEDAIAWMPLPERYKEVTE